jgi:type VI secretion system protein ImpI
VQTAFILNAFTLDNAPVEVRRHKFAALPIRIGRNPLNDYQVRQLSVSSFHARIEDVDGKICIRDLGSKNGVFIPDYYGATMPKRAAADTPIDLSASGFQFFLGPQLRIQITFEQAAHSLAFRDLPASGSVLGNPAMLLDAPGAGQPPGMGYGAQPPGQHAGSNPPPAPGYPSLPVQPGYGAPQGYPGGSGQQPAMPMPGYPGGSGQQPAVPNLPGLPGQSAPPAYAPPGVGGGFQQPGSLPQAGPGRRANNTQFFDEMGGTESLAIQGLRELAGSLVPGLTLETSGDVARFITKLHDAVDVFCRCFIPLREGYTQFVSSLDLARVQKSAYHSEAYAKVAEARTPEAVAAAMLDFRDRSFDAPQAIEGMFADLMLHQMALLDGVMRGVRALLDELSPENLENQQGGGALGLGIGKHKALWQAYRQRYEDLSEERQAFAYIFGPEFTNAYRQYRARRAEGEEGF